MIWCMKRQKKGPVMKIIVFAKMTTWIGTNLLVVSWNFGAVFLGVYTVYFNEDFTLVLSILILIESRLSFVYILN